MSLSFKDGRAHGKVFTKEHDQSKLSKSDKHRLDELQHKMDMGEGLTLPEMSELLRMRRVTRKGR